MCVWGEQWRRCPRNAAERFSADISCKRLAKLATCGIQRRVPIRGAEGFVWIPNAGGVSLANVGSPV